jgi:hypothetical protein
MKREEFEKLNIYRKAELIMLSGDHLMGRIFMFYTVQLFTFSDFYTEIWYRQADNHIDRIIVLELTDVLNLYEGQIGLSDLSGLLDSPE